MTDPSLQLQAAITAALKNANVASGRIYDPAPKNAQFPYVTFGPGQVLPDKADCIDGTELFPQLDGWSQLNGSNEIHQLGAAIIAALDDQPLTVSGFNLVVFELQSAQYLIDPDGKTRHVALTFRALLQTA